MSTSEWKREWRKRNPEKVREYERRKREKNPEGHKARMRRAQVRFWNYPEPTRPKPEFCECCGGPPGAKALHLDHDHKTGAFRGWLCHNCNLGIGRLGDTIENVKRALAYMTRALQ